jgi:hypothetical protein
MNELVPFAARDTYPALRWLPGLATSPMEMSDLIAMIDENDVTVLQLRRKAMLEAAE